MSPGDELVMGRAFLFDRMHKHSIELRRRNESSENVALQAVAADEAGRMNSLVSGVRVAATQPIPQRDTFVRHGRA